MSKMSVEDAPEETLDPADTAAWSAFRRLAHRMVDDMLDHLSGLPEQPVWRPMPTEVRESFHQPVPRNGVGADAAYEEFLRLVRPYPNGNLHPRYWGWVKGNGTPLGMMADMLRRASRGCCPPRCPRECFIPIRRCRSWTRSCRDQTKHQSGSSAMRMFRKLKFVVGSWPCKLMWPPSAR